MLIKENSQMTEAEKIVARNLNSQFLKQLCALPLGIVFPYSGEVAPTGFAICQGQRLEIAAYPDLFAVIGYKFGGSGDYFNLPDLRGKIIVGYKSGHAVFGDFGASVGSDDISIGLDNLPYEFETKQVAPVGTTGEWAAMLTEQNAETISAVQSSVVCNYIIKLTSINDDWGELVSQDYDQFSNYAMSGVAVAQAVGASRIQLEEMPTLTDENFDQYRGKVYQYVGNVANPYYKGYYYMAHIDSDSNIFWQRIDTQPHQDISGKLTEPNDLAVGKTFRISSIDGNGHAVLECVETTCRQVLIGETTTTEDVATVAIEYGFTTNAQGNKVRLPDNLFTDFDKLVLLVTFPDNSIPSGFGAPLIMVRSIYELNPYSYPLFHPTDGINIKAKNTHTAFTFDIVRKPTTNNLDVSIISTMTSNANANAASANTVAGCVRRFNNVMDNWREVRFGKGIQFSSGTSGVNIPSGTKIELFGVKY